MGPQWKLVGIVQEKESFVHFWVSTFRYGAIYKLSLWKAYLEFLFWDWGFNFHHEFGEIWLEQHEIGLSIFNVNHYIDIITIQGMLLVARFRGRSHDYDPSHDLRLLQL